MKSIERLNRMLEGGRPDRAPFVPSIYEHGARVIDKSPGETSRDARLMAAAAIESFERYGHDIVTVGVDIYNIEAEAFGCELSLGEGRSVPGVKTHPLAEAPTLDAAGLAIPEPDGSNRLGLIAQAAAGVVDAIGDQVWVYGCMGGPFSQAVELRGFENLIVDMMERPQTVHGLLEKTTELSIQQARRLSRRGCGVYLYESWATLPLIDPGIFGAYVVPYNKRVIAAIRSEFTTPSPAVIMGGDTAILIDFFIEAGAGLVVADYNTDFEFMKGKIADRNIMIRGCADPKTIERGDWESLGAAIATLASKAQGMANFIWGCGCVSYNTPADHVLRFKEMCLEAL